MSEQPLSYYGRPIVKPPTWKPEIPIYFFTGGLGGVSAALAAAAQASGNDVLARRASVVATAGLSASPYLLIKDLGRPLRFYNMFRVFKPTSPLSVGTWLLATEGTATGLATVLDFLGLFPRLRAGLHAVSGMLGPPTASYTGAVLSDSVVPVWHEARRELPFVFASGSAAAAGGLCAALTPSESSRPARRLAVLGAAGETVARLTMEKRLGELVSEPYRTGTAAGYARAARTCFVAGGALMAFTGRHRAGAVAAGALLAAGSWCGKFAAFHAGKQSAADPTYTSIPQRARAAESGQPAVSR